MKTTIWVRQEDEEAWKEIKNKGQWVHDMLNQEEDDTPEERIRRLAREEFERMREGY